MKTELIESLDFTEEDYNEKIAGEKLRRSRRNDIIKKMPQKKAESQRQDEYRKKRVFCGKNIPGKRHGG